MEKNIEIELRGPLTREKMSKLEEVFEKEGKLKEERERVLIDYSTFLPEEGIKNRTRDIRLRATNGRPEIIVKIGKWGGEENRKELSAFFNPGDFDKLVQIFSALGFNKGVLCVRKSKIYDYKGVEFALVEVPGHSYYFEAELLLHDGEDRDKAAGQIKEVCGELGLEIFSDEDFFSYIKKLNEEANEVFDFNDYRENYFKERFGL